MCTYALFLFAPLTALYCLPLLLPLSVQIIITQSVFTSHIFYHMFLCLPLYRLHTLSSYHRFSVIMSYVGTIYVAHINNCAYINLLFVFLNPVYFASLNDLHFNPFSVNVMISFFLGVTKTLVYLPHSLYSLIFILIPLKSLLLDLLYT